MSAPSIPHPGDPERVGCAGCAEGHAGDLELAQQQLLGTEIQTTEVDVAGVTPAELNAARTTVKAVMELTQQAINHLGAVVQLPLLIQASNQKEVRSYAVELLSVAALRRGTVDEALNQAMEGWQVKRLAQVDRDLLRLAVVEMAHLGVPSAVAINEAVELAKRYSDQDGFRFINGVLRRWLSQFRAQLPKHSVPKS